MKLQNDQAAPEPDLLIIAANARSLVANRGDLIAEAKSRGSSVEAAVPDVDYLEEVENLGIPIHKVQLSRTGLNPLADLGFVRQLRTLCRQRRPKAVFAYGVKPVVFGLLGARLAGLRSCYAMVTGLGHAYTTESPRTRLVRLILAVLYRVALRISRRTFFQNPDDLRNFVERGFMPEGRAVLINGSGINLERFPVRPLPDVQGARFLFVGRLLHEKGLHEFVAACRLVAARHPGCEFVVVGGHDPSLPHSVAGDELAGWEAEGIVRFVGAVKDVRSWLEWCSVLVLPSYREGTPRSVLEAMSTGRAIITTDVPGCRETTVDGVNGYLVEPKAIEPLAGAMLRIGDDPETIARFATASRRIAEEKYDVHKVNEALLRTMELA
jgi:glycosyltransferase involved in cell wall biosynthesis